MGRNSRLLLGILVVGGLAFLADYFFLHLLFPMKRAALMKEINSQVESSLRNETAAGVPAPGDSAASNPTGSSETPGDASLTDNFEEELKKCLPGATDENPTALAGRYTKQLKETQLVVENWHLGLPNGEQRRLMLIPSDRENAKNRPEVRWFSVDSEGLPVPLKLDPEKAFDPKPEFIAQLKGQGTVIFQQRKESNTYKDGTHAEIEWVDGSVKEIQLRLSDRTLSCADKNCQCR